MKRIVHNVTTGETTEVEFTPKEVAEVQARAAAEDAKPKKLTLEERVAALEAKLP